MDASVEELRRSLRRAPIDEWPGMRAHIERCRPELAPAFDRAVDDVRAGWTAEDLRVRVRGALVEAAAEILAAAGLLSDVNTAAGELAASAVEPLGVRERLARAAAALAWVESLEAGRLGRSALQPPGPVDALVQK